MKRIRDMSRQDQVRWKVRLLWLLLILMLAYMVVVLPVPCCASFPRLTLAPLSTNLPMPTAKITSIPLPFVLSEQQ